MGVFYWGMPRLWRCCSLPGRCRRFSLCPALLIYLVRNVGNETAARNALKRHYTEIFEQELGSWYLDRNAWPKKRGYRTFKQWFELRVSSVVLDLEKTF